jgi:UDP:flavonoid glycosyltransferase YjiC (YdhE family)
MARILLTSTRQAGFVLPLTQLAAVLVRAGHEVFFLTGAAYEQRVRESGATFVRLPYERESAEPAPLPRPLHEGNGVRQIAHTLRALFLDPMANEFRAVRTLSEQLGVDLILTESLFVGATVVGLLPRDQRPAVLAVGLVPLPFSGADVAPYGMGLAPIDGPLNLLRNTALSFGAEHALLAGLRHDFIRTAERLTGVRPRGPLFDLPLAADAYAQLTVPAFEYPRRSLSPKVRFVGPLPPPVLGTMPDWWDYAERRPIVHVTQGTYANADPAELIVPTIRALADEPVLVVATTGGRPPSIVADSYGGPLPANSRVASFLPYSHLLAASSVVVTSGGYGTVHHALRWGVPLVVSGTTEDKAEVNARVAWSGAGVNLGHQHAQPDEVRAAVRQVLADPRFRQAAGGLGRAIAETDAAASVAAMVDELVAQHPAPAALGRRQPAAPVGARHRA